MFKNPLIIAFKIDSWIQHHSVKFGQGSCKFFSTILKYGSYILMQFLKKKVVFWFILEHFCDGEGERSISPTWWCIACKGAMHKTLMRTSRGWGTKSLYWTIILKNYKEIFSVIVLRFPKTKSPKSVDATQKQPSF